MNHKELSSFGFADALLRGGKAPAEGEAGSSPACKPGKSRKAANCEGCVYRKTYLLGLGPFCDYSFMEGKTRLGQMTEEERRSGQCRFRKEIKKGGRPAVYSDETFYQLWQEGKTDREISRSTGAYPETVKLWRKRRGLESNGTGKPNRIDYEKMRLLYMQGWNDREIGEEMECDRSSVGTWRRKNRLPVNKRGRR